MHQQLKRELQPWRRQTSGILRNYRIVGARGHSPKPGLIFASDTIASTDHLLMAVRYCTRCVYPAIAATPLTFDEHGVCSGCRVALQKNEIDWKKRWQLLKEMAAEYRSTSNYDIII